jgi:hypothetical protein
LLALVAAWRFLSSRNFLTVLAVTASGWIMLMAVVLAGVQGIMGEPWQSWVGNEGGRIRKIPQSSSQVWLVLKPGTELREKAVSGDHVLVETPYGIQGWIEEAQLLHGPGRD